MRNKFWVNFQGPNIVVNIHYVKYDPDMQNTVQVCNNWA